MAELSEAKQEWIDELFSQWGAWEFSGIDAESKPNQLYMLMKSVEGRNVKVRQSCSDDVGILMNKMINFYIRRISQTDYEFLEAHYIYCCSVFAIAKWKYSQNNSITERQWRNRINGSIKSSQWIVAKMLESAVKNHNISDKLQKLVFFT